MGESSRTEAAIRDPKPLLFLGLAIWAASEAIRAWGDWKGLAWAVASVVMLVIANVFVKVWARRAGWKKGVGIVNDDQRHDAP